MRGEETSEYSVDWCSETKRTSLSAERIKKEKRKPSVITWTDVERVRIGGWAPFVRVSATAVCLVNVCSCVSDSRVCVSVDRGSMHQSPRDSSSVAPLRCSCFVGKHEILSFNEIAASLDSR